MSDTMGDDMVDGDPAGAHNNMLSTQTMTYKPLNPTSDEGGTVAEMISHDLDYQGLTLSRTFSGSNVTEKLHFVQRVRHQNFVNVNAVFRSPGVDEVIVSFEFMPIVVVDLCSQAYTHLNQLRLAAIMGQVSVYAEDRHRL